jgi:hypothetical protein
MAPERSRGLERVGNAVEEIEDGTRRHTKDQISGGTILEYLSARENTGRRGRGNSAGSGRLRSYQLIAWRLE